MSSSGLVTSAATRTERSGRPDTLPQGSRQWLGIGRLRSIMDDVGEIVNRLPERQTSRPTTDSTLHSMDRLTQYDPISVSAFTPANVALRRVEIRNPSMGR